MLEVDVWLMGLCVTSPLLPIPLLPPFSPPPSLLSFLDEVSDAGEHAQEFLELLKKLSEDKTSKWKSYLAMRGVLPKIGCLIGKVCTTHLTLPPHLTLLSSPPYLSLLSAGNKPPSGAGRDQSQLGPLPGIRSQDAHMYVPPLVSQ